MSQYEVDVVAKVQDSALDAAQAKLDKLTAKEHTIKLGIDDAKFNASSIPNLIKEIERSGSSAGRKFSSSFQSSVSNKKNKISFDFDLSKAQANAAKQTEQTIQSIQRKLSTSKLDLDVSNLGKQIKNLEYSLDGSEFKNLESSLKNVNNLSEKLKGNFDDNFNLKSNSNISDVIEDYNRLQKAIEKCNNETRIAANSQSGLLKHNEGLIASQKTISFVEKNTKLTKAYRQELQQLAKLQQEATSKWQLNDLNKQVALVKARAEAEGVTGRSVFNELGRGFKQIAQFATTYGVIERGIDSISQSIEQLKQVDDILTEISKTSDLSSSSLKQLGQDAYGYASNYGKTVTDYLQGVTEMSRSGFYGQQGVDMANVSVLAQAAGDMNADTANSYLLATNAAYEYAGSAQKLNDVLDGQNMISNRNSVSMTDLAEATTQAGSMAAQTGVSVNELSALVGTAVSRTKKSGNEIGTALKALFVNLTNTSNDKVISTLDNVGISMTKMVGDSEYLKTPIELLKELSDVYNALPDGSTEKADILNNIGQKHHANVLASILSGQQDYDKMLKDYSEGSGSAAIEAEKSANNWKGSLNQLSNSWQQFISNFADAGQITSAVQLINQLVKGFDGLVKAVSPLGVLSIGGGAFAFFKNLD